MMADEDLKRLQMKVPAAWLRSLDEWRREQPDLPTRSEAIRRLVLSGAVAKRVHASRRRSRSQVAA